MELRKRIAAVIAGALVLAGMASAEAGAATRAHAKSKPHLSELLLGSTQIVNLFGLAAGPDGNLWFPDIGCAGLGHCVIARVSTDGKHVATFSKGLNPGSVQFSIVAGPDGDLWFTDTGETPAIGRITPSGKITEFSRGLPPGSQPFEITAGPGGLWFTDQNQTRPAIGRITTKGRITEFTAGLQHNSVPFGIAAGPHHRVYFTDHGCIRRTRCEVGYATARGLIHERSRGLRRGTEPLGIAAGPDGTVWFADASGAIGQIKRSGRIVEFSKGLHADSSPVAITAGPDGDMWFSDEGVNDPAVGQITPKLRVTEYDSSLEQGSEPAVITPAADGRLWFTDEGGDAALGRARTGVPKALARAPAITGSPHVGALLSCGGQRWATWADTTPSLYAFGFDGYHWLRDRNAIVGHHSHTYRVTKADAGHHLSCRVTATYPAPFHVTAVGTSARLRIRRG